MARELSALGTAVVIFLVSVVLPRMIDLSPQSRILTTQGLELGLSLLAIFLLGRGRFAEYGFTMPRLPKPDSGPKLHWVWISLLAVVVGAAATLIMLLLGGTGNPIVKSLSIVQMILLVWVSSSTIEEIFTRGFLQGHLSVLSNRTVNLGVAHVELPVVISALFFMCMHLVLVMSGVDVTTIVVLLVFAFFVGLLAGHMRARTGSLLAAIGVHFLSNFGGFVGGIVYAIVSFVTTGQVPKI